MFSNTMFNIKNKIHRKGIKSWNNFSYPLQEYEVLNEALLSKVINIFWDRISKRLFNDKNHLIALFRIKNINGSYWTIGKLRILHREDKDYFIKYILNYLNIKGEEYKDTLITEVIISFGIRDGKVEPKNISELDEKLEYQKIGEYNIPITLDPLKYGNLIYFDTVNNTYVLRNGDFNFKIQIKHHKNYVEIYDHNETVLKYIDQFENDKLERIINNDLYIYEKDGEDYKLVLSKISKVNQYIDPSKKDRRDIKFICMDLETMEIKNKLYPYLISWYDGNNAKSFFLLDFKNSDDMIKQSILTLCKKSNRNKIIYIHNLSKFDIIFLLRILSKIGSNLNLIINNGKFIEIELEYTFEDGDIIYLVFRDSYNILLASLEKLAKSFGVDTLKSIFPHKFVNNQTLNYQGEVPDINYFYNVSRERYNEYLLSIDKNNWNLKKAAISYCENDCKSLWEVIDKFNKLFYNKFKIYIHSHPTLPSLAFRLFRTHYLNENTIPMIYGKDYKLIKQSYTGGATDMYIPTNEINELVYCYDINSLYPFVMSNFPMPIGNKTYFEGDIRKIDPKAFGFFYCKIITPGNLNHPILQTHVKTKNGIRTIAALGTYYDMIFSPSMDNAIKYGYQFEIQWGYTFEQDYIFKDFVKDLYQMRLDYPKSDPMNYIAKINMNSLYGKFGMKDEFDQIKIVDKETFDLLTSQNTIINEVIELDDNFLIKFKSESSIIPDEYNEKDYNINVAIASAITSYSRDYMSQFKNNPKLKLFYTDTDSIYTNLNPDEMNKLYPGIVNDKKLGALKLEMVATKAIFLAPKVYCLQSESGKIIFKVKGLKQESIERFLSLNQMEELLYKDKSITLNQSKWYKSLTESTISIIDTVYNLKQTENKRILVYNNSDKCIDTKPINLT